MKGSDFDSNSKLMGITLNLMFFMEFVLGCRALILQTPGVI